MASFTKESLENLRQKIDLVEVISPYVPLKRAGASYKAVCPFHNEKSPSFHIQKGDSHYHCFGCGAHGDAISFLMNHLKMEFAEAIEMLAGKFGVTLEYTDSKIVKGPDTSTLKTVLNKAAEFYHFHLLHTDEGRLAVNYLYKRGLDLDFIRAFKVGFSPKNENLSATFFKEMGFSEENLLNTGLLKQNDTGRIRPFFSNRIMFPIHDTSDNVIGFSARKIDEATFGGKYINTSETVLFKKSKVLFGLNYSRKRIAKERKAIIVEGQIDALRLIHEGLNITVASQGTAFGTSHVEILQKLGINHAYLAFDGDTAGREAAIKVGQFFQIEGIEVSVLRFKGGDDPDLVLQKEGVEGFLAYLKNPTDYITFLVEVLSSEINIKTPAGKNELATRVAESIRAWRHPVMIHEGLRKLATLLQVPEMLIDQEEGPQFSEKVELPVFNVDASRILESDLLRWLFIAGKENQEVFKIITDNLISEDFIDPSCKALFARLVAILREGKNVDLIPLAAEMSLDEQKILEIIHQKKVNGNKAKEGVIRVVQKILERKWLLQREMIKKQIESKSLSEEEVLMLAKEFDRIKKETPKVLF